MTFDSIPESLRNPTIAIEIGDPLGTGAAQKTSVIMGQMLASGTGAVNVPVQIFSADDAAILAGVGSQLHREVIAYLSNDRTPEELLVVPLAAGVAAAAASKTYTLSFSTGTVLTESGRLSLCVGGRDAVVNLIAGQSIADIGDAVEAVFGADEAAAVALGSLYPVTCANTGGALKFTARDAGACGNDIRITINYWGPTAGERFPGNLTCDAVDGYLTGGSGVPDLTVAFTALDPLPVFALFEASYSSAELIEKKSEFAARWGYDVATYGGHYCGVVKATLVELLGSGTIEDSLQNDWHCVCAGMAKGRNPSEEFGAAYMGACVASLRSDPSRPIQTVTVKGMAPIRKADRLRSADLESLTAGGFATAGYDVTGAPIVSLERTTMLTSSTGTPISGGEAVQYPYCMQYIAEDTRSTLSAEYPRSKLVDDASRVAEGVDAVDTLEIKATIAKRIRAWELAGIVENADAIIADLVVVRNVVNRNRVDIAFGPDLANQLRVMALRITPRI